ncbi:hypothetical protein EIA20_24290, partial [Escherichia coli]
PKTSIICSPMTSLKTSIKTITYLSDTGCLEIQGASLPYDMVCLNQSHRKQCITYINNMFLRYLSLLQEF